MLQASWPLCTALSLCPTFPFAEALRGLEASSPLHLTPLSPLFTPQPRSQRPDALSWILFWAFAFWPQLTPTSCITMSDSFVSPFRISVCERERSDHPSSPGQPSSQSLHRLCLWATFIPLFTSCLLPSLTCKVRESRETCLPCYCCTLVSGRIF